ncbi:MAG: ABC transporter permease [Chelatococcus sp.]|jgi:ABC-type dipeptide/oligopeptide/nickel transport system permease component|uniref:ABC transporter permease n=1 Tax=unclassified Chelatococcus TaxID=2638111 RepID=UPI001BCCA562|nr:MULTISPECIES: ABC transporter permease [unclassified Chelatococcus]CAH1657074.1 ABC transporter permease subunit [Hyphomicrobiales bacterium]MBS7742362.1 ABC transporter permease [Chelatococcus sp. HY11]MBX3539192.1 ABC transporter permease [Chelatococcus sp.]MBX3542520.1 ABC transporter permease [Chelatococcus sp.]MCO5075263.1 ABC transporter permease [Chelatococcus sp.]
MIRFMSGRLLRAAVALSLVLMIAFVTVRFSGEPFERMFPEGTTVEHEQALRQEWNLDKPLTQQFMIYLGALASGQFGQSLFTRESVWQIYAERLPATLAVGGLALLVAIVVGIPLGAIAALWRQSVTARLAMWFAFLGYAIPHYVLGIGLVLLFGFHWHLLPTSGLESASHFVLPVLTLAIPMIAALARYMRAAMLDAIAQPHVMTALSKGISERRLAQAHILRNAMVPLLTVLGLEIAGLVNGSIFVETVFSLPGVGRVLVNAVLDRNYPVLQFGVLAYAAIIVVITLVVDLLYTIADPRVRLEA